MPLLVVRHAPTALNAEGGSSASDCLRGWSDIALSPVGRRIAEETAAALATQPLVRLYSSDLSRAMDSAAPLAVRLGLVVEPRTEARSWNYGAWTGMPTSQAMPLLDRLTMHPFEPAPDGEAFATYLRRWLGFAMPMARAGALVGVYTHGRGVKAIEAHLDAFCQGLNMETWRRHALIPPGGALLVDGTSYRRIH